MMIDTHHFQAMEIFLQRYGYGAVFSGILFEDFGVPLPGETLLIAGVMLAAQGHMDLPQLLLLAVLAAVVGDNIGYLIGRYGGRSLVLRFGRYVFLDETKLAWLEAFFQRHGGKIVIGARFFQGLRQFNGVIAGMSRMRWERFLLFNVLGAMLWVGAWGGGAYFVGRHMGLVAGAFWHLNKHVLLIVAAVVALAFGSYLVLRKSLRH